MRALLFFIALLCFFYGFALPANAASCPQYVEPRIVITPIYPPPREDHTAELSKIRLLSQSYGTAGISNYQIPVGLTAASLRIDSSFAITSRTIPGEDRSCSQISHFNLRFGFDDTTIYVAKEIPKDSCSHKAVLNHEAKHVAADKYFLDAHLARMHDLMAGVLRKIGVLRSASPAYAEERFHDVIDQYLHEMAGTLANERQAIQQQIDTAEEYARLSEECNGEISLLVMTAVEQ